MRVNDIEKAYFHITSIMKDAYNVVGMKIDRALRNLDIGERLRNTLIDLTQFLFKAHVGRMEYKEAMQKKHKLEARLTLILVEAMKKCGLAVKSVKIENLE